MRTTVRIALVLVSLTSLSFGQTNALPTSGNVGVGTTTPLQKLSVAGGTFNVGAVGDYYGAWLAGGQSTDSYLGLGAWHSQAGYIKWFEAARRLAIYTTSNWEPLTLQENGGNVGIGTTNPTARLQIERAANDTVSLANGSFFFADTALGAGLLGQQKLSSPYEFILQAQNQTNNAFFPIKLNPSGGNVVIGPARPYSTFTVSRPVSNVISVEDESNGAGITVGGSDEFVRLQLGVGGSAMGPWGGWIQASYDNSPGGAGNSGVEPLLLNPLGGNVGIGTTTPSYKLAVNGAIRAKEVIVDTGWSDFVFAPDYALAPLSEVEAHIKEHQHLPGIPSASEVAEHGISVGEMQAILLAKIEELTLHAIEQQKTLLAQSKQLAAQSARLERLEAEKLISTALQQSQ